MALRINITTRDNVNHSSFQLRIPILQLFFFFFFSSFMPRGSGMALGSRVPWSPRDTCLVMRLSNNRSQEPLLLCPLSFLAVVFGSSVNQLKLKIRHLNQTLKKHGHLVIVSPIPPCLCRSCFLFFVSLLFILYVKNGLNLNGQEQKKRNKNDQTVKIKEEKTKKEQ